LFPRRQGPIPSGESFESSHLVRGKTLVPGSVHRPVSPDPVGQRPFATTTVGRWVPPVGVDERRQLVDTEDETFVRPSSRDVGAASTRGPGRLRRTGLLAQFRGAFLTLFLGELRGVGFLRAERR